MKIKNAQILATHLSLGTQQLHGLGENDRSSIGFLPPVGFEEAASQFFARPSESVLGWEPAVRAQKRITNVVDSIIRTDRTAGAIAIVSHGAVGTLLFCRLCGCEISRKWDQPANGGGNYFSMNLPAASCGVSKTLRNEASFGEYNPKRFTVETRSVLHGWKPIDALLIG